ncbi:MAG: hypothetical protein GX033_03400, partial [Firmicutes bacterium]|nr:hypothetical protein [Bacillota bacterium]
MKQKTLVHSLQAALVIFASTIGTVYFPLAAVLIPFVSTASWYVVLIAFLLTTLW